MFGGGTLLETHNRGNQKVDSTKQQEGNEEKRDNKEHIKQFKPSEGSLDAKAYYSLVFPNCLTSIWHMRVYHSEQRLAEIMTRRYTRVH